METMLQYLISTLSSQFSEVKEMMEDTISKGKGKWINAIEEYRLELGLTWEQLRELNQASLKRLIKEYDTIEWYNEMRKKQSLRFYIKEKTEVKYEMCYRNSLSSAFYARARINSLKLEEQIGRGKMNYDKKCKLCEKEEEDIVHFTIKCGKLEGKRNYELINKELTDPEERMRALLFRNENHQEVGRMIKALWDLRGKMLKDRKIIIKNKQKKPQKDERRNIKVKVIKNQDVKMMKTIEKDKKEERKKRVQIKIIKNEDVRIMQEIKEVKQLKAIKEEKMTRIQTIKKQDKERGKTRN